MTAINNADELRAKIHTERLLACDYGVQQNLLISLKNLNNNPPYFDFDIGLPPHNHQSHLWDYDLQKSVLYDLSKQLGMNYIENNEIINHIFDRMYESEIAIEILARTIFELLKRGFSIEITHFLGINFWRTREGDELLDLKNLKAEMEHLLVSCRQTDMHDGEFLMHFSGLAHKIISTFQHELVDYLEEKIDYDYGRGVHVKDIGFIPNIGLSISVD